ncbi:hypothetical protein [Methylomicrobium sp. Wu6]|uniref:hypothetical protein n=1 Tax=Methylomicrobium sp. Wu6 TaxID=3107928 RepID=UPI002DD62933|nr:hypothetical protein [Methylomicrobium sp. Wu6]MEC4748786.1 hypothetical protein [Methylomicrobium sp. Wu6]
MNLTFGGPVLVESLDDPVYLDKLEKVIGYHYGIMPPAGLVYPSGYADLEHVYDWAAATIHKISLRALSRPFIRAAC